MELHFLEVPHSRSLPYYIYLGDNHIVEVKTGGEQIGVYVITASLRRRGVVLPYVVWTELINSIDIINLAIDLAKGTLGLNIYENNEHTRQLHQQASYVSYQKWGYDETDRRYS